MKLKDILLEEQEQPETPDSIADQVAKELSPGTYWALMLELNSAGQKQMIRALQKAFSQSSMGKL